MNKECGKGIKTFCVGSTSIEDLHGMPWLVRGAVEFLEMVINKESSILEIGAGSSTIWFAERAGHVVSFEGREEWVQICLGELLTRGLENVVLNYKSDLSVLESDDQFDVCLIDSPLNIRMSLSKATIPFVRPGGYLVFDNSNRPVYKDLLESIDKLGWRWKADFRGTGYVHHQPSAWVTTIWRKNLED